MKIKNTNLKANFKIENKSFGWLLSKAARIVIRSYNEHLAKLPIPASPDNGIPAKKNFEISASQSGILALLYEMKATSGNPTLSQKEIGELLFLNKVNSHKLINGLEQAGLVTSVICKNDKRARQIDLTPQGDSLIPELVKIDQKINQELEAILFNEKSNENNLQTAELMRRVLCQLLHTHYRAQEIKKN